MLVTMDVGNTNTVLGVYRGSELVANWRPTTARDKPGDEYGILTANRFSLPGLSTSDTNGILITPVAPPVNGPRHARGALPHRRVCLLDGGGQQTRPGRGVVAHEVALEPIADLLDCQAFKQRRNPALLVQQVMDQCPHIPLRARSAVMPLFGAHARDQCREPSSAPAVQLYEVICHQMRARHSLSIRWLHARAGAGA